MPTEKSAKQQKLETRQGAIGRRQSIRAKRKANRLKKRTKRGVAKEEAGRVLGKAGKEARGKRMQTNSATKQKATPKRTRKFTSDGAKNTLTKTKTRKGVTTTKTKTFKDGKLSKVNTNVTGTKTKRTKDKTPKVKRERTVNGKQVARGSKIKAAGQKIRNAFKKKK